MVPDPISSKRCKRRCAPDGSSTNAIRPVLYRSLSDDPKTLDPSVSYTVDDSAIIDDIAYQVWQFKELK